MKKLTILKDKAPTKKPGRSTFRKEPILVNNIVYDGKDINKIV